MTASAVGTGKSGTTGTTGTTVKMLAFDDLKNVLTDFEVRIVLFSRYFPCGIR